MKSLRAFLLIGLLTGCSSLGFLNPLGSGPNVNAQVGKEVTQQVVGNQTKTDVAGNQQITTNKVSADKVETVVVQEIPAWVILLLLLGWLLPSPNEIGNKVARWFRK